MKRRTAVISIGVLGLGGGAFLGNRWNLFDNQIDLEYLNTKNRLVEHIVDVIIPKTDTPGAAECDVHNFVIMMIKDAADKRSKINFIEGLQKLEDYVDDKFKKRFYELPRDQKADTLRHFEKQGKPLPGLFGKAKNRFFGKSFFLSLKEYTSMGYFTSQKGATEALSYVAIPTRYIPCVDLSEYPKSWATE